MSDSLHAYSAYKDSGVPWLGQIPAHWAMKRLKHVVKSNPSKSESASSLSANTEATFLPMESVSVDGQIDTRETRPASSLWNGFTYFRRNDVLVAKITPCFENGKGACLETLPTEIGFGSTEFMVLRATSAILPQFLYLITKLSVFRALGADAMSGAAGQQRVPTSFVSLFQVALPPIPEQCAIVRFLDLADRRIKRYIRAKQKLIKLLEEQKHAIIHQAVTRGLDPTVRLKPSGVEWLGDVPEHWDVLRSKYLFREIDSRSITGCELHLSMSQKYGLIASSDIEEKRLLSESHIGGKLCAKGDLVLNRLKAHLGVFALAPQSGIISPDYTVLRPCCVMEPRFFEAVYRTPACRLELRQRAKGIVQGFWRLYTDDFYDIRVPVPPVNEQYDIMRHLDADLTRVNTAISRTIQESKLIQEYRTRLIADVVTGKLDVREAAAQLPDEPDEVEPLDALAAEVSDLDSSETEAETVEADNLAVEK